MKKLLLAALLIVGLNTQVFGFATIVQAIKGGDEVSFTSNVEGVTVFLDGVNIGKMGAVAFKYKLNRTGAPRTFMFKKKGHEDQYITVNTKFDNMFWGNAIFGGLSTSGSSTDSWSSNNTKQYSPNQFYVALNPVN